MRIRKYRVWDGSKMRFPTMLETIVINGAPSGDIIPWFSQNEFGNSDMPIMEFTGLKDKNDMEIYEGDIIDVPNSYGYKQEIKWSENENYDYRGDGYDSFGWHIDNFKLVDYCIIGNIYENPHLLEACL